MTASLQTVGQLQPLQAVYIEHPGVDEDGVARGHLLIVDGALRFLGACAADWDVMTAIIAPYRSMAEVMLDFVAAKLTARPMSGAERGRLILRTRVAYEHECALYAARGLAHPMKAFFTQAELAKRWGVSQPTIHRWVELAAQPMPIPDLMDRQAVTEAQVSELLTIKDPAQRVAFAERLAARPAPSKRVRAQVIALAAPPKPLVYAATAIPYDDLWSVRTRPETPPPVALGALLHDVQILLAGTGKLHPALRRVRDAVDDPAIIQFMRDVRRNTD